MRDGRGDSGTMGWTTVLHTLATKDVATATQLLNISARATRGWGFSYLWIVLMALGFGVIKARRNG